jgi:hypothetical protein
MLPPMPPRPPFSEIAPPADSGPSTAVPAVTEMSAPAVRPAPPTSSMFPATFDALEPEAINTVPLENMDDPDSTCTEPLPDPPSRELT